MNYVWVGQMWFPESSRHKRELIGAVNFTFFVCFCIAVCNQSTMRVKRKVDEEYSTQKGSNNLLNTCHSSWKAF